MSIDKLIKKATEILYSEERLKLAEKIEKESRLTAEELHKVFRW